jgi:acetyl-CoA synthetase
MGTTIQIPERYNIASVIDGYAEDRTKVALYWENEAGLEKVIPYWKLRDESNQAANGLKALGLAKGDRVLILLPRLPEAYYTYLAALKLGLVVMPGSEMLRPGDISYRIKHVEATAVICHADLTDRVEEVKAECPSVKQLIVVGGEKEGWLSYDALKANASRNFEAEPTRSDDLAFLSYTSGTTGGPKGVVHVHGWAYAHSAVAARQWMDVQPQDVVWATAGPGWAKWVWSPFVATLGLGASALVYHGKFDPTEYLSLMEKYHVGVLCCTPTEYRLMAKVDNLGRFDLSSLHSAVSAGEPLNREVIDTFQREFSITVRDGYGQTENSLLVGNLVGDDVKGGSMGRPTPGNEVSIINEDGEEVGIGEAGDIAVRRTAPTLFKGYFKDPERTNKAFRGDWYLTGDQARKDEDGYFWFEGRSDDIIISSGYTIGPFEVEDALVKHPAVAECAVVASPDELRGHIVKAFVILRHTAQPSDELISELQEHVKKITAPYKYPRKIEFVTELPKTTSGKIRRIELRLLEKERYQQSQRQSS